MKYTSLFVLPILIGVVSVDATAMPLTYAGAVSGNNIGAMQFSLATRAMDSFKGNELNIVTPRPRPIVQNTTSTDKNSRDLYGTMPMYGTMPVYGEYGDDGTVFMGRNGGDVPTLDNMWIAWQHYDEYAKFDNLARMDVDYDLVMAGVALGNLNFMGGTSNWGVFGGYVGHDTDGAPVKVSGDGGYFGIYNGFDAYGAAFDFVADFGAIGMDAKDGAASDDVSSMWAGLAANVSYKIMLDDTFALVPGIYGGYTWIDTDDYTVYGNTVRNDALHMFNVAPGVCAVKHIADGWYGTIGAQYVFTFTDGGATHAPGVKLNELDIDDYSEYGIGLEKSIDKFGFAININRRDGARTGWNGGIKVKYVF